MGLDEALCRWRLRSHPLQVRHRLTSKECWIDRIGKVITVEFQPTRRVNLPREEPWSRHYNHQGNVTCKTLLPAL